jgi:hypothetical protein
MDDNSALQINAHEFFTSRRRHCKFHGTAKKNENGTWRIHVFADWIASIDVAETDSPYLDMYEMYIRWKIELEGAKK